MRSLSRTLATLAAAVTAAVAAAAAASAGGGPAPGVTAGWDGVRAPAAPVRYVAIPSGAGTTAVAAVSVQGGRVTRFTVVKGDLGVPIVAFDGTTDGLSADGSRLVLSSYAQPGSALATRFAVLRTKTLRVEREITLPGAWAFDAVSPDGSTVFAVEYLSQGQVPAYRVRAIDVASGRPLPGQIVDRREPGEKMIGLPYARARGERGWVYTLYGKPDGTAFVHALDTRQKSAVCIDLPWRGVSDAIVSVRLAVAGGTLTLRQASVGRLAVVDLRRFEVRAFRRPVARS